MKANNDASDDAYSVSFLHLEFQANNFTDDTSVPTYCNAKSMHIRLVSQLRNYKILQNFRIDT